jgi:hypothetical protein
LPGPSLTTAWNNIRSFLLSLSFSFSNLQVPTQWQMQIVKWALQNKQRDWPLTYGTQFNTPKIRYTFINLAWLKI